MKPVSEKNLAARLDQLNERIARACRASGRSPEAITLIGISKTKPAKDVAAAHALGLKNFPDDEPALTFVLFYFLFIIVIVMMNVLIAIVSDSYADAMTRAEMLFWCSQLDLIAESTILF